MWWTATLQEQWTVTILPPASTTVAEYALEAVDASLAAANPVTLIPAARSYDLTPTAWLPYLAAERSVDEFSSSWTEARQRAVVENSFRLHQRKGTRRAMEIALAPLGYSVKVVEWFEFMPRRQPYTFRLVVNLGVEDWLAPSRSEIVRTANSTKNAHTKLQGVDVFRQSETMVFIGGIVRKRRAVRVGQLPKVTTLYPPDAIVFTGVALTRRRTLVIHQPGT
jgi:phage tail P2-like protein